MKKFSLKTFIKNILGPIKPIEQMLKEVEEEKPIVKSKKTRHLRLVKK